MTPTTLYRVAAALLLLFAVAHTYGFLKFAPTTSEGLAVRDAMKNVTFDVGGKPYTYGGFYTGFGLYVTAYLLFSAYLAWHLGMLAASTPQAIGSLGWAFFALQLVGLVLSGIYFFPPPIALSAVVAIVAGWAAWLVH